MITLRPSLGGRGISGQERKQRSMSRASARQLRDERPGLIPIWPRGVAARTVLVWGNPGREPRLDARPERMSTMAGSRLGWWGLGPSAERGGQ